MHIPYYFPTIILSQALFTNAKTYTFPAFESSTTYFEQSDPQVSVAQVKYSQNFGLKTEFSWQDVLDQLDANHKLFFLIRHGFGVHQCNTPSTDWTCYWETLDGYDGQVWADALLTQKGIDECTALSKQIKSTSNFPFPNTHYSSPLRRTLQTWQYVWKDITNDAPIIKEYARETYGIQTESKRHSKTYIHSNWPYATFEDGFTEDDKLWEANSRETGQHRKFRAASLLNDIFDSTSSDEKVISIVSHSGMIGSLLKVVGHREYPVDNAVLIPVLVQRKKHKTKDYVLDKPDKTFSDICPDKPSQITQGPGLTCSAAPFSGSN
ncbi:hypothetical protein KGF56_000269 [Candida oxycetoniae]|uniref:Phosphomutase n=1 Tax=Candida oxycetoniae TaxID=497107 RepID=A0AAI9T254_9ASCO|nr:uncharacterized protein KGF56_000269 [Candida oxycetoniae]KAI3406976.2 hypothetical protein KGF56_000269 [Candida oxycetoniae]